MNFCREVELARTPRTPRRSPLYPGNSQAAVRLNPLHREKVIVCDFAVGQICCCSCRRFSGMHLAGKILRRFFGWMRTALPLLTSTNVAATFPSGETSTHACPTASCDHGNTHRWRSGRFSTKVTSRLRLLPLGSSMPSFVRPASPGAHRELVPRKDARGPLRRREDIRRGISFEAVSFQPSAFSLTLQSYFLRHRTPSFVFSMTMPRPVSSDRRASETLKLRPRRVSLHLSDFLLDFSLRESTRLTASRSSALISFSRPSLEPNRTPPSSWPRRHL